MTVADVMALLESERDERGMHHWERLGASTAGKRSFGIGLTRLRRLAKRIRRDAELACRKAPDQAFILADVERVAATIATEQERVRLAMASASMGIGKRSAAWNAAALAVKRGWVRSSSPPPAACASRSTWSST